MPDASSGATNAGAAAGTDAAFAARILAEMPETLRAKVLETRTHGGQSAFYVKREDAFPLLQHLRDRAGCAALADVTAVDFLNQDMPERFQVVYVVQERGGCRFLRVHAWVPEDDAKIRSVYELWRSAAWAERECHDMFGIHFDGAPDLRRFLMPEDYPGFPLLKDYPLKGRGERVQFPRVVPVGDEIKVKDPEAYPTTIGRGMHTPEYLEEIERDSKPRP